MKIKRIQRGGEFSNVQKGVDSEKIDWLLIKIKDKKKNNIKRIQNPALYLFLM